MLEGYFRVFAFTKRNSVINNQTFFTSYLRGGCLWDVSGRVVCQHVVTELQNSVSLRRVKSLPRENKTGTSKVGTISEAQKAQSF